MLKKILFALFASLSVISVTACGSFEYTSEESKTSTSDAQESICEASEVSEESVTESSAEVSVEVSVEVSEDMIDEESIYLEYGTEELTILGKTENGFIMVQIDGAYYIDGILIVNKTYALPENYPQVGLTTETLNALYTMKNAAKEDGLNIYSRSDFRSYQDQAYIYKNYCNRDGQEKADTYSARPGHSEHQSGLAIDINKSDDSFIDTPEAIWLKNHCAEYGFIIRYPKGKSDITGYKYEPWHVRYVGKELASKLYLGDGEFTTIEEYFGITSAYAD